MSTPRSLNYYGGKQRGKGAWIASLLPWEHSNTYVEPFAGMAGVLLARQPVRSEILNDLNERIVNWWRVVRDQPEELAELLEYTPWSRRAFEEAKTQLDDATLTPLRRALAFHIVVHQNVLHADNPSQSRWRPFFTRAPHMWRPPQVKALADRLRYVQLECRDAVELLAKVSNMEHALIYCDPPYHSADTSPYTLGGVPDGLADILRHARAKIAVSGYGNEWDSLGWERAELPTYIVPTGETSTSQRRTEVLWTNYQPPMMLL